MNRLLAKLRPGEREERANGARLRPLLGSQVARTNARHGYVLNAAETTPCTCPEFCERDHGNE
jgi:hypothetical protein